MIKTNEKKCTDIAKNITNVSDQFEYFSFTLSGPNYQVSIEAKRFYHLKNNLEFSIQDLKELYLHEQTNIKGEIISVDFLIAQSNLNKHMAYTSEEIGAKKYGDDWNAVPSYIANQRTNEFWKIIEKNVGLPFKKSYAHIPNDGSFFNNYLYWGFSYIFLNETKGIFINIEAFD